MKKIILTTGTWLAALLSALVLVAAPAAHAADVGVSLHFSQPGVYGRVDIGRFPQPALVVAQPVIVQRAVVMQPEPVYMWVPPGHRKNWRAHCGRYGACGVPVYFVQNGWYQQHVVHAPPPRHVYGPPPGYYTGYHAGPSRHVHDHHHRGGHGKHDKHDRHGGHRGKHRD